MRTREILALYGKYTAITLAVVGALFAAQVFFVLDSFRPVYLLMPLLAGLGLGAVVSTAMLLRKTHQEHVVWIYVKYTLLALGIVGTFFFLQVTFVIKEFKPHFLVVPVLLGLLIGLLLSTVVMFKQRLQRNNALLADANAEIGRLNARLKADNLRMGAELAVTRQLQQMLLPRNHELERIAALDIAGFMEPADEVGGDYYDVLEHDGRIKIGIGDVTGHGLESGVLMIMVQMAVRTLLANNVTDPATFLATLNRAVFENVQRMGSDKNLTLALLDYEAGILHLTGQHEEILVVRRDGGVERIDTIDLGFMVGLEADIGRFLSHSRIELAAGDGVVLYTDGITEARNPLGEQYGVERLAETVSHHWDEPAKHIVEHVVESVKRHIDGAKLADDITLLVCKQR